MANPFDQFDQQEATQGNVFDQFDESSVEAGQPQSEQDAAAQVLQERGFTLDDLAGIARGSLDIAKGVADVFTPIGDIKRLSEGQSIGDIAKRRIGIGETALMMGTGAGAEIASGIAGIQAAIPRYYGGLVKEIPFFQQPPEEVVKQTRQALTYNPKTEEGRKILESIGGNELVQAVAGAVDFAERELGDAGFDVGGPVGGAIGATLPTAVMEGISLFLGGAKLPRSVLKGIDPRIIKQGRRIADIEGKIKAETGQAPTMEELKGVVPTIEGQVDEAVTFLKANPQVARAAQELGIPLEQVPAGILSDDRRFREIAMALSSSLGSKAGWEYGDFVRTLKSKADEIIREGGGTTEKYGLSQKYRDEARRTIEAIKGEEGPLSDGILEGVGESTRVDVGGLREFVDAQVQRFGGVDDLPKQFEQIHSLVYKKKGDVFEAVDPTFAKLDLVRKEVGSNIDGKLVGAFAGMESGLSKTTYGVLSQQVRDAIEAVSPDLLAAYDARNALTIQRKAIEGGMVDILGQQLSGDLMPVVASRIKKIPTGEIERFERMIQQVPEGMRQEVVVSALNDIMKGAGADQFDIGVAPFTKTMGLLNRDPTAKAVLYKYLPEVTQKRLDDYYTLVQRVYDSNKGIIKTGKIAEIFPDNQSFVRKMFGETARAVATSKGGPAGRVAADVAGEAAERGMELLGVNTLRADKAADLITSDKFKRMVAMSVRSKAIGGEATSVVRKLERELENTKQYKAWLETLDGRDRAQVMTLGIVNFLMEPTDEQN